MPEGTKTSLKNTFKPYPAKFEDLLIDLIETDPNQPRKAFGLRAGGDHHRLLKSIQTYGIEDPIKVCEIQEGRYLIMDGHRRLACARELEFQTVPCRIYPKMHEGEMEARRYEMQNNRRSWRPIEKANAIHKIKSEFSNSSEKEVAELIGLPQSTLLHYRDLRNMRMEYLELMSEHNLKEFQRFDFVRLLPKLRKIKQYQVDDIVNILFDKIDNNLLYRRSDFGTLYGIFTTASFHEEELCYFLTVPEVSVTELREMAQLSGLSAQIAFLIKDLGKKKTHNTPLTEKEKVVFEDLYKLMETFM